MNEQRLYRITTLIWIIFGFTMSIFLITAAASKMAALAVVAVTLIMAFASVAGTLFIWQLATGTPTYEKAKHDDHYYRIERLVHLLDDEDLAEIENQIKQRSYRA